LKAALYLVRLMAYNDMNSTGLQGQSGVNDMLQQRPARNYVQDFRRVGKHAFAFSSGKNDNFEGERVQ
jgi:hypothetical protein